MTTTPTAEDAPVRRGRSHRAVRTRRGRWRTRTRLALVTTALAVGVAGCAEPAAPSAAPGTTAGPTAGRSTPTASDLAPTSVSPSTPGPGPSSAPVVGTVVRFASDRASVDVTIGEDSPATRDLLALLPLELELEDLSGKEKIGYLPRALAHDGTTGSDPEDGDLIYFTPWGNLGFYYDATGIGYSGATLHLGTYQATADQLALLEGEPVTVTVVP